MAILNLCRVLVLQNDFGKIEFVPNGVLGGYCRGTGMVRKYSKDTAEEMEIGHV
jgi:hypothetical protein